jgi:hypothetical protein
MINFKKSDNSLVSLGVGKRVLITKWLDEMAVANYTINDDFTIDSEFSISLWYKNLTIFPEYIKFGKIAGYFNCSNNQLISLKGCPDVVDGNFYCSYNNLSSLKGCPNKVGGYFFCIDNNLQFTEEDVKKLCNVKKEIFTL